MFPSVFIFNGVADFCIVFWQISTIVYSQRKGYRAGANSSKVWCYRRRLRFPPLAFPQRAGRHFWHVQEELRMCGEDLISRCQVQSAWRDLKYSLLCIIPTAVEAFIIQRRSRPRPPVLDVCTWALGACWTLHVIYSAHSPRAPKLLKLPLYNDAQAGKTDWFSDPPHPYWEQLLSKQAQSSRFLWHSQQTQLVFSSAVPFL